jgi:hypothetical protein
MIINSRKRNLIRLLGIALCMPLMACGTSDVNYISRSGLAIDPLYITNKSEMKRPTNYGAIKFQKLDDAQNEGSLFVIQKKKGVYQAETMFKSEKDKKYYFSVGMNYRNQAPTVGMRIEF